jgi:two-component system NtrC family sensor kinase
MFFAGYLAGSARVPIFYVETGPDAGKRFDVKQAATIGRLATNQVKLGAETSREHTRLVEEPDGWYAIDLGSRNGTLINGKKVSKQKLAHGDRITIGKTVIRVEDPAPYHAMGQQPPTIRARVTAGGAQVAGQPVATPQPVPQRPQAPPATPIPRVPAPQARPQPPVIPYPQQPPPEDPKPQPYCQVPAPPAVVPQVNAAQPAPPVAVAAPSSSRLHPVGGTKKLLVVVFFIAFFIVLFLAARWVGLKVTDGLMEKTRNAEQQQ